MNQIIGAITALSLSAKTPQITLTTLLGTVKSVNVTSQTQFRLNGRRVGKDYFTPGWTDYKKRVYYNTYDVTDMLARDNVIAAVLGDGWYAGYYAFDQRRGIYGKDPRLLVQLDIEYEPDALTVVVP